MEEAENPPVQGVITAIHGDIVEVGFRDRLPGIKSPTMIITGTADRIVPFKNSELLEERIPGAELVLLQDKQHVFFIEAMDSTRIFVNGFIKRKAKK